MVGMGWWMDVDVCGLGSALKLDNYYIIYLFACAKDANHSQIIGSPDPLFYLFH